MDRQKLKNQIIQIIKTKSVNQQELPSMIVDYCGIMNHRLPNNIELQGIINLLQSGFFNIDTMINNCIQKLDIHISEIIDKNGNRIILSIS